MTERTLILLRHGQSTWNESNQFTGWVDVKLTEKGKAEAKRAGELLREHDLLPDILYTSLLTRAIASANIALDAADRDWIPVKRSWRLNERFLPYWESTITDDLDAGRTVLVAAHGNSLRALVKHLDGISDGDIAELNIPTGIPLVYKLGDDNMPLGPGEYLDPEAAAAGAAAVARAGQQH